MKVKVDITESERYPDFEIDISSRNGLFTIEVEKEVFDRWNTTIEQYDQVQREIKEIYESPQEAIDDEENISISGHEWAISKTINSNWIADCAHLELTIQSSSRSKLIEDIRDAIDLLNRQEIK